MELRTTKDMHQFRHDTIMKDLADIKTFVNHEYWKISSTDENLDGFAIVV